MAVSSLVVVALAFVAVASCLPMHPLAMDNMGFVRTGYGWPGSSDKRSRMASSASLVQAANNEAGNNDIVDNSGPEEVYEEVEQEEPKLGFVKHRSELAREEELRALYRKIASEFPFLAKQGLASGKTPSLNDLFAMTVFGQPRHSGRK